MNKEKIGQSKNPETPSTKAKSNLIKFFDILPTVGLVTSLIMTLYFFYIRKLDVNPLTIFYVNLAPIIYLLISYFVLRIAQKKKYLVSLTLLMAVFVLTILASRNTNSYKEINLKNFYKNLTFQPTTYAAFISDNCTYCKDMEDVYKDFSNKVSNFYFVNIREEDIHDDLLRELDIKNVPALVRYEFQEESKRVEGVLTLEELEEKLKS